MKPRSWWAGQPAFSILYHALKGHAQPPLSCQQKGAGNVLGNGIQMNPKNRFQLMPSSFVMFKLESKQGEKFIFLNVFCSRLMNGAHLYHIKTFAIIAYLWPKKREIRYSFVRETNTCENTKKNDCGSNLLMGF